MKKMMERLAQGATRLLVLALGLGLAEGAWAVYAPGDTLEWSNTNTTAAIYSGSDPAVINECHFDFQIPASADLPARSIVKIKSITFASLNPDGKFYREQNNYKSDPGFINLNGVKSDAVNGVTFSGDDYTGTFTDKINSTTTQEDYALKYTFTSDCRITVGTTYAADTGSSKGGSGKGIAFLHPNGNCIYGSSTDKASVRYVQSPASNALITPYESTSSTTGKGNGKVAKDAGYYPVYIVKAEVVSIPDEKSADFEYNAVVGNEYSTDNSNKWGTSTPSGSYYRVGPNCNGLVIEYSANNSPNWGMAAKDSAFSFITYADVSQTQSSGKIVLFAFGASSGNNTCVLYREGEYIKLGYYLTGSTLVGTAASLTLPSAGYHLIAGVCDPTKGTLKLYVGKNDGTLDSATGGTATEQTVTMNAGFQICSIYHGKGGFTQCNNLALAKILGFDRALTAEVVESFLTDFPATDGTQITADIDSSIYETTLTVYTSSATGNQALIASKGNVTIPANNVVNVPQMRMDTGTASSTVTINGQLNITSTMDPIEAGKTPYDLRASYKGILMGGAAADGAHGHCIINGVLNAPNAYFQTERGGSGSDITIQNGGSLLVKGLYDGGNWADSICTINLTGGGTLQVGEIVTMNVSYPGIRNFGNGTYKVLTSGEENTAITFNAGTGEYTILDPAGTTLTIPDRAYTTMNGAKSQVAAVKGTGDIKVASSVSGGKVKFNSLASDYTGNITVAADTTMELVAGTYAGTITVESGGTLEINPGASVDYTCNATLAGAGSVVIKSGSVTLANAPTVTSAISVDAGATLKLPTGTISGVTGAGTLEIPDGVEVTITANNVITVASLKGPGSLVLSGVGPGASNTALQGLLQNSNWNGTFAIMPNVDGDGSNGLNLLKPHLWGNSGSKLQLTGVAGFFDKETTAENVAAQPELVLVNGTGNRAYGYNSNNGWSYTQSSQRSKTYYSIIRKLSGTGKLYDSNAPTQLYVFNDASGFSGSIYQTSSGGKTYLFDADVTPSNLPDNDNTGTTFDGAKVTAGTVDVRAGASISIGSGESWTTRNGIRIAGNVTLKGSATLSSATTFVGGSKLIFEAGSVLNVTTVTLPSTGTVTLDVSALTIPSAGYTLISGKTFTEADCAKFSIVAGTGKYYALEPDGTTLKIYPNGASITANQSVVRYESLLGAITALLNSEFADAYVTELGDNTAYGDSDLLGINIAHDADGNYYKATVKIGSKGYKSLARAIELAADEDTVTLIRDNGESSVALNDKTVSLNEYNSTFTGSFTGSGTLALTALLKSADPARWAEGWTGTVVLPENANVSGCNFDNYGIDGSTVCLAGATTATWLSFSNNNNNPVAPTIEIPEGASFTLAHTGLSSSFAYTFKAIKGAGAFSVNISGDIDLSDPGYSAYFLLKDVSNFTGSLSATGAGIAIGDTRIANTVAGGKIIVSAGKSATIASGETWSAANGIEVNGTLNVAGTVTGGITGGDGLVNLTGGSVDLGTLGAAITHKYVAVSGESSLTLQCEYNSGSGVIFNGDTIESPFIKVESGATLNLSYGNFSGWNGDVCDGYIVNEGTLNISQKGSVSTFFRNHLILTDGCTTTIGGTGKLSLYGGVATESTAQIQLVSGEAEISSESAGIGFGNVSNQGGYGGKGVGFTVGDGATLTISARIYASNVSSGSNPLAKYGNGTLVLSHASNSAVEPWTLNAGAIKSVVALTVNSGDLSKRVSDVSAGGYHVYSLVPSPAEVTATTFDFNSFTYGGQPVSLGEGDTIIVPSDCEGNQWHPSLSNAAGHPVIVRKEMNWKAVIGTMSIDSGVNVYAYGDNGTAINDGSIISGTGTLSLQDTVPVSGAASVLCTIGGAGAFSLADGATLTVSSKLPDGKVTTSGAGKLVGYNPETMTYSVDVSITGVTFDYYASYTNADVTATVGGAGTYTLSVQGKDYVANAEGAGTVTFANVDVSNTELGSGVAYTITATGAATGSTSGTSEQKKGTVVDGSGWMLYNKTETGVGSWTDGDGAQVTPDYGVNDYASLSGTNVYSATGVSTGDVVTVTTVVVFGGAADSSISIDADAQAALRVSESGNTFQVYTAGPAWVDVGNDDLGAPVDDQRYTVTLRIDYGIQKFFLDITKDETVYSLTNAAGQSGFALASGASGMRQVQYKGAGSFVSIEGSNILTGYMADVGTAGNVTNVAVSADFVSEYLAGEKASAVPALLSPSAERTCNNGLNYFESYALGLDPTEDDDKLVVDVSTDASGNFVFTVKHPIFEQGNITGYEEIDAADNVQATVTYKYGTTVGGEENTIQGDTISPSEMFNGQSGNVRYYKAEVSIGAK